MRSIWRTIDRDIVLACAAVWLFGLSYGAIATTDGFPVWLPMLASLLVIAGSSELLFVGVVAAGGSPIAAALAACWSTRGTCRTGSRCPKACSAAAGGGCSART